jgi:spore maturation protein CgeB
MKLVIFGLSISSSWGNGHATIMRGLCRSLRQRGHSIVFFERDVPYYAAYRDCPDPSWARLYLYDDWAAIAPVAREHLCDADVAMATSYCPDGPAAAEEIFASKVPVRIFYDLDTPVTLDALEQGKKVAYIGPHGLRDFDLVLSFTGGKALVRLEELLGAQRALPLYGCVDPETHFPSSPLDDYRSDLSYLGTYSADRQEMVETLLLQTARRLPEKKFLIGGSLYPPDFPWAGNLYYINHIPPPRHPAFYCSSAFTLNVTRHAMAAMGYCPSGRLFEAAACATPIISDVWEGLEQFYMPGSEIILAKGTDDVVAALSLTEQERMAIARRARQRTMDEHTAHHRAWEFEKMVAEIS